VIKAKKSGKWSKLIDELTCFHLSWSKWKDFEVRRLTNGEKKLIFSLNFCREI
jgi:hypothetical protein